MNTPSQVQRGRKRKADKPHQPNSGYVHQNRGYQQPLNENQRRQQATFNSLSALQDKPFPQTPQAGHAVTSGLTVGDIGAGMAPGISIDDEFADNVVDDLDRLTPRDLAAARYTRNHEMLDIIFDSRRVDKITPPSSYYSTLKKQDLESRLSQFQKEISDLTTSHSKRMKPSSQIYEEEVLSAQKAREEVGGEEEWEKSPSSGKILGLCVIRATTPPEAREFLEKQEESLSKGSKAKDSDEVLKNETEEERSRKEMEMIDKVNQENGVGIILNDNNNNNSNGQSGDGASNNQGQNQDQMMNQNETTSFDELLAASGLSADAFTNMDSPSQQMDFTNQEGGTPQN